MVKWMDKSHGVLGNRIMHTQFYLFLNQTSVVVLIAKPRELKICFFSVPMKAKSLVSYAVFGKSCQVIFSDKLWRIEGRQAALESPHLCSEWLWCESGHVWEPQACGVNTESLYAYACAHMATGEAKLSTVNTVECCSFPGTLDQSYLGA